MPTASRPRATANRVTNLINFSSPGSCDSAFFGCYAMWARHAWKASPCATTKLGAFNLHGSVDFQNPRDTENDKLLARRAKRYATLGAETRAAGWTWAADLQTSAKRFDNAANINVLGATPVQPVSADRGGQGCEPDRPYQQPGRQALPDRTHLCHRRSQVYVGVKWMPR
ncbi:hypothetical protein [Comamonas sp. JC664]|uniref:hypothetical protein n=1 Tax=Comamonas sp. JC664 TaxID=2801917 RepID=UPI00366B790B